MFEALDQATDEWKKRTRKNMGTQAPAGTPAPAATITPAPQAAPTAQHHFNLALLLSVLEKITAVTITLAPIVAAPFVKNANSQAIVAAELPAAQAVAELLTAAAAAPVQS